MASLADAIRSMPAMQLEQMYPNEQDDSHLTTAEPLAALQPPVDLWELLPVSTAAGEAAVYPSPQSYATPYYYDQGDLVSSPQTTYQTRRVSAPAQDSRAIASWPEKLIVELPPRFEAAKSNRYRGARYAPFGTTVRKDVNGTIPARTINKLSASKAAHAVIPEPKAGPRGGASLSAQRPASGVTNEHTTAMHAPQPSLHEVFAALETVECFLEDRSAIESSIQTPGLRLYDADTAQAISQLKGRISAAMQLEDFRYRSEPSRTSSPVAQLKQVVSPATAS